METAVEIIAPALFDYAALDTEARIVIQQRAGEIRTIAKRLGNDIVEIGGKLAEVKTRLGGNGRFSAWLEAEFGWSERTVANWIAVWQRFNGENFAIEKVATSALYLLAAPSTPAEAVEAAKALADQGETVTHAKAETIVKAAKAKAPKQTALLPEEPTPEEEETAREVLAAIASRTMPATPQVITVSREEMVEIDRICLYDKVKSNEIVELFMRGVELYLITDVFGFIGQSDEHAIGWQVERIDTPRVVSESDCEPRTVNGKMDWTGVLVNSGTQERAEWYRVTGPRVLFQPAPQVMDLRREEEAEVEPPSFDSLLPEAWLRDRIEITIALLPHDGPTHTRPVLYSVKAGERVPFFAKGIGEPTDSLILPWPLRDLIDKQMASLRDEDSEKAKNGKGKKGTRVKTAPGDVDNELAGTPVETVLSQAELDRVRNYCCPQKIAEGKPIPLCKINGNFYVITGGTSSGRAGAISVDAWPAVPLTAFGEENARTYQDASNARRDQEDESVDAPFYEGVKVNCGTKRKPDWRVMVGPEIVFTADYAADYPDDEIETAVDDDNEFTAARCEECGRIDGAHTEGCETGAPISKAIYLAFLRAEGCKAPMKTYREISVSGERDAEIRVWIAAQNQAMAAKGGAR